MNTMNITTNEQPSDEYIQKLILAHKRKVERERLDYDSKKDEDEPAHPMTYEEEPKKVEDEDCDPCKI